MERFGGMMAALSGWMDNSQELELRIQGNISRRFEQALQFLDKYNDDFSVSDGFSLLQKVHQEGLWATRVSFVCSAREQAVYYTENNKFEQIKKYSF